MSHLVGPPRSAAKSRKAARKQRERTPVARSVLYEAALPSDTRWGEGESLPAAEGASCSWSAVALAMVVLLEGGARAADSPRVVVRVTDPTSRALMQRIRGQTSDLDQELVETVQPALEPRIGDELATARRLAAQQDARVVVWFDTTGESFTLFFSIPREGRTLVRTMERAAGHDSQVGSATLESAALVVRSVLRAVASGATIGVTLAKPLDVPVPEPPPTPAPPVAPAPLRLLPATPRAEEPAPEARDTQPAGARVGWLLSAGWHSTLTGSNMWLQGVEARGGVCHGPWTLGIAVALDAPTELSDRYATVRLSRDAASAFLALAVPLGDAFRFGLSLGAGAAGFPRRSVDVSAGVAPAADALNTSPLLDAQVGVALRQHWQGSVWALALRVGADVVVAPPTIGYEVSGAFVAEHALWTVQPKAVLGLEVASF